MTLAAIVGKRVELSMYNGWRLNGHFTGEEGIPGMEEFEENTMGTICVKLDHISVLRRIDE